MIRTLAEFDDATAFERWALEGLVPLPATRPHGAVRDLEHNAVRVTAETAIVRVYAGGTRAVHIDLRPLAFGAAWKVLDLLIELALSTTSGAAVRMSIAAKVRGARLAAGVCLPLTSDADLWAALTATYAATEEVRHSLVHRLAEVDQATGTLTGRDGSGSPLAPLSADHQEAFCRAVQWAAHATLAGGQSSRERSDLAWNLDELAHLHGHVSLGGQQMMRPPLGVAPTRLNGAGVLVDAPTLLHQLRRNFPDRSAYDATFELPDGRHLLVELEHASDREVTVDLSVLPDWAEFWEGPT